jgi:protein-disulfide isomerase
VSGSRRQRREAELAERREQRHRQRKRQGRAASGGLPLLPISLGVLAVAVAAVLVYALFLAPPSAPPAGDVRSPAHVTPAGLADGRALGDAEAPLTIGVWSDFQCPACGTLARDVLPLVIADYVTDGEVRLVFHDYAFLGQESIDAAVGARCAERQGRFWQFHDFLFANQSGEGRGAFSETRLEMIAQAAGLDVDQFRACVDEPGPRDAVAAEVQQGRTLRVVSTPTMFVGDERVVGVPRDYAEFTALIDRQLSAAGD